MIATRSNGLARAMTRAHMDPPWLAKRVGVDPAVLEAWIQGHEPIPREMAVRLSAKLKTTVADILFGVDYDQTSDGTGWQMRRRGR